MYKKILGLVNKKLFLIIPLIIAVGIGIALLLAYSNVSTMDTATGVTCTPEQLLIQDKSNNQSCADPRTALNKVLDGSATIVDTLENTSNLITKLALSSAHSEKLSQQEIFEIGTLAYVYGYSPNLSYESRQGMAQVKGQDPGVISVESFQHFRQLLTPAFTSVITPNADTMYSIAWVDLSDEPTVFHVPDTKGRYYVMQINDFYTNPSHYIGMRATGTAEAKYLLTSPDWKGDVPAGLTKMTLSTNANWIIGRTLVKDQADVPNVHKIQDAYILTPLSLWKEGKSENQTKQYPPFQKSGDKLHDFFTNMNNGMTQNPPPSDEQDLMDLFKRLNIGSGQTFDVKNIDDSTKQSLTNAMTVGDKIVTYSATHLSVLHNGWQFPVVPLTFGDNYVNRAAVTKMGLGANAEVEAVYPLAHVDANGDKLTGKNKYTIHFDKDEIPPAKAFWSISMYDAKSQLFIVNDINRYDIGDRTQGLKYNDDKSLDIIIQHDKPSDTSNWLPAPKDDFYLAMRIYNPEKPVIDGTWQPTGVQKSS